MILVKTKITYKPVSGFPGYRVGDDGSVWSRRTRGSHGGLDLIWRRMKTYPNASGHLQVRLNPGKEHRYVHHLVLESFVGLRAEGQVCRHFPDSNPDNNRLENLRWGTVVQNVSDRDTHGNTAKGERIAIARLTESQVLPIRESYAQGTSQRQLGRDYCVDRCTIRDLLRRRTWKHI